MITVFTPTYNRAHLLPRLYESLCRQTFTDFEWVIVDDGSTDGTKDLFHSTGNGKCFLAEIAEKTTDYTGLTDNKSLAESVEKTTDYTGLTDNKSLAGNTEIAENQIPIFPIRYFYQENGGKHRAINRGVKEAKGELFFIADSDDMLPPNALETVAEMFDGIKADKSFAGVCGLDSTFDGNIIGSGLSKDVIDESSLAVRFKRGVMGDMKEVFRTVVLKEFPFPEIGGERFCPEMLLWNRIATKYKLRYFNKVIYLVEYQDNGISSGITKARINSPVASMMTYAEMTQYDIPFIQKVKAAINYWRFWCPTPALPNGEAPRVKWWWYWAKPLGRMMHLKDNGERKHK